MEEITTVGIDLAKSVFQVPAVDATGRVVVSRAVRRAASLLSKIPPCLVGMEACFIASLAARVGQVGHDVRPMPPPWVNAYVRRQKNDAAAIR